MSRKTQLSSFHNQRFFFSWPHVVAFIAIIFIAFVSFLGITFLSAGNIIVAAIGCAVIVAALLFCFLGAQYLKGTDDEFYKNIKRERILVYCTPAIFVIVMIPYVHFWTVYSNRGQIINEFSKTISLSEKIARDYKEYANDRIQKYDRMLTQVILQSKKNSYEFKECGFSEFADSSFAENVQREKQVMVKTLYTQLLSPNCDTLCNNTLKWLHTTTRGASIWNVFFIGNIKKTDSAICKWQSRLIGFASKKMSNEEFHGYNNVTPFEDNTSGVIEVRKSFRDIMKLFVEFKLPGFFAILSVFLLFALLLLPYVYQERNSRSRFFLWKKNNTN